MSQIGETQLHTIFVLLGPSNCGKTYFSKNILIPQLTKILSDNNILPNIQYISSDNIRRDLCNNQTLDKYDVSMYEVSKQAFNILYTYLDNVTQFPVNCHFAILDTTGMSKEFRDRVLEIAKRNNYNVELVLFNFNNVDEYFKYGGDKKIISSHVTKLRNTILKELGKDFNKKHTIKNHGQYPEFKITDLALYKRCLLDTESKYIIIGDIHECIDETKQLLINIGFLIGDDNIIRRTNKTLNTNILFVGDLTDKGRKTKETVEFFYKNLYNVDVPIKIVNGNHDNAVMKLLTGKQKETAYEDGFVGKYYSSYIVLKNDEELAKQFLEIESTTLPFLGYLSKDKTSKSFYVTHAPCHEKYVGKVNRDSIKYQRYIFSNRDNGKLATWNTVKNNINIDSNTLPFIVSGHFAFPNIYNGSRKKNNRLLIDTGCVHGNFLTGVLLGKNIEIPRFYQIEFMKKQEKFNEPMYEMEMDITDNDTPDNEFMKSITKDQYNRITKLVSNSINFISGTISPAPVNWQDNDLESLKEGLKYFYNYFTKNGINMNLSVQPKYMGSRCNVYLFKDDIDKSYMVSRNGYVIHQIDNILSKQLFLKLHEKLNNYMVENKIKLLIIDSELMPWNALGSSLINKTFKSIDTCINDELSRLTEFGFEQKYSELLNKMTNSGFEEDQKHKSKKELSEKYDTSTLNTYRVLNDEKKQHVNINLLKDKHNTYHEQLEIFGKDGELEIKPFGILKIVYEDGHEIIPGLPDSSIGQVDIFNIVSSDKQCIIDFNQGFDKCFQEVNDYFDTLTKDQLMEGIVIKPNFYLPNFIPCMKVRNHNYLTIIYGYDYTTDNKYSRLMKQKNINKKIKTSIDEFNLGIKMLQTKYSDINENNINYCRLLVDFLFLEETEKDIDPRL